MTFIRQNVIKPVQSLAIRLADLTLEPSLERLSNAARHQIKRIVTLNHYLISYLD